jgi:hypothetical protein
MVEQRDVSGRDEDAKAPEFRWRFSLRALLALMTLLALSIALVANRPTIAAGIAFILVVAGVLQAADRFVASMNSPKGEARFSRLLFTAWMAAGGMFLILSGVAFILYGAAVRSFTSAPLWSVLAFLLCGSFYCFFKAAKVLWRAHD